MSLVNKNDLGWRYKFGCHQYVDDIKTMKLDEITKDLNVEKEKGQGCFRVL